MIGAMNLNVFYCTVCDKYFVSKRAREEHIQKSTNHPQCEPCQKRFAHMNALRTHYVTSNKHHYCSVCEKFFETAAGFKVHIEVAAVHRDDSDDEDDEDDFDDCEDLPEGWEDEYGRLVFPQENERHKILYGDETKSPFDEYLNDGEKSGEPTDEDKAASLANDESQLNAEMRACMLVDVVHDQDMDSYPKLSEHQKHIATGVHVTCPVCLKYPTSTATLGCGHLLCTRCIRKHLNKHMACPVCWKPTKAADVVHVKPCLI